jgi:predicted RNase H-like nuclease
VAEADRRGVRAVLGIDAAWTGKNPSGVALIAEQNDEWHCVAVAPSYAAFLALAEKKSVDWTLRHAGETPEPARLLEACRRLINALPTIVTVDMPLATTPIMKRRIADSKTSKEFGKYWCAVHSPNAQRPGAIGESTSHGFTKAGYPLATAEHDNVQPCLLEVYPHAAIVRLMNRTRRLTYKESKMGKYWPDLSPSDRLTSLQRCLDELLEALDSEIAGIELPRFDPLEMPKRHRLKAYEDALDALVCAWVGKEYLAGRAEAFGDESAAIWVPKPR